MKLPANPVCAICVFAALLVLGPVKSANAEGGPPTDKLGEKINKISLKDSAGKDFAYEDVKHKKLIVVVFLSFDCPVSTSYLPELKDLVKRYGDKVAFIGVRCGKDDADLGKKVEEYELTFPVLRDEECAAAHALKAGVTPEAFVLDDHFVLRYRGRIDNRYAARLKKNAQNTRHDLQQAVDELLAGKPVNEPATLAVGCAITREKTAKTAGAVTYYRDVAPILQERCQGCHRPGEVGPFSLTNYEQAVNWSSDIKDFTQNHKMPPWKPTEGLTMHGERKLTEKEIMTLAAWVDGGTPEGDRKDAPAPKKFPEGWQLGKPDLVLTPSADFQIGPNGDDLFRCFVLPTTLPEDVYVSAVEVRPGNPRVVHHALLFIDGRGKGRQLEEAERDKRLPDSVLDRGPGYSTGMGGIGFIPQGGLSGWAPGNIGYRLPDGTGFSLPKNADVIMQIHYHRDGKLEKDRTQVGLYFAKKHVDTPWKGLLIPGIFDTIPPGKSDYKVTGGIIVNQDCILRSVMPHMHMVGKEIKVTFTPPEGAKQTLIAVKDWDYNWQETYFLKEPLPIKRGTRLEVEAIYDNSTANPLNPFSPPQDVNWGEQTTNEMCFIFLGATSDDKPGLIKFEPTDKLAMLKWQANRLKRREAAETKKKEGADK
jgi:peroxiredoxin